MTTKTDLPAVPVALADVAFHDIKDVCAAVRMSSSWVHDEVKAGRFPPPMRFGPRCSRWRAADIRSYLIERAKTVTEDAHMAAMVAARAKKASAAAAATRAAAAKASSDAADQRTASALVE